MSRPHFAIDLGEHGRRSVVWLDEWNLSNYVDRIEIEAGASELTRVTLSFPAVSVGGFTRDDGALQRRGASWSIGATA